MIADLRSDMMTGDYPFYGPASSPFFGFVKSNACGMTVSDNLRMQKQKRIREPVPGAPASEAVLKQQMARNLRDIRLALRKSVLEMAKRVGVPLSTYKKYEAHVSFIPHDIIAILLSMEVSPDFLYLGIGTPLKGPQRAEMGDQRHVS